MSRKSNRSLIRWLEAERRGDEVRAESALAGIFRFERRPRPSAGFAHRVLERIGLEARQRPSWPRWVLRGSLATALTVTALSILWLPALLPALASGSGRAASLAIGLVAGISERLAHGLTVWNVVAGISRTVAQDLMDPSMMTTLLLGLLMSFLAFGWLRQLLALERSTEHV